MVIDLKRFRNIISYNESVRLLDSVDLSSAMLAASILVSEASEHVSNYVRRAAFINGGTAVGVSRFIFP